MVFESNIFLQILFLYEHRFPNSLKSHSLALLLIFSSFSNQARDTYGDRRTRSETRAVEYYCCTRYVLLNYDIHVQCSLSKINPEK